MFLDWITDLLKICKKEVDGRFYQILKVKKPPRFREGSQIQHASLRAQLLHCYQLTPTAGAVIPLWPERVSVG